MNSEPLTSNREQQTNVLNGWVMLPIAVILSLLLELCGIVMFPGFFTLQPNEARVLILFGAYKGTVRRPGFHWGNPFYSNGPSQVSSLAQRLAAAETGQSKPSRVESTLKKLSRYKISLRARNFNSETLKVNDKRGNPVEIACV